MKKKESAFLRFLYHTFLGRIFLKLLCGRGFSKFCGWFLNRGASRIFVKRFIYKNEIDLALFEGAPYRNFNDCFSRKIKAECRPIDFAPDHLIAPCDGLLSVYPIKEDTVMPIKQSHYTVNSLLQNEELAKQYQDGICLVFRLCVNHYHRYAYLDDATKGENVFLKGKLHTVRPIALEKYPVFAQNCREYTVMQTENFGAVTQIEIGAMLVGKIKNLHGKAEVKRGQEKGMFLYGGSSIAVLLQKGVCEIDSQILENTQNGEETPVQMGQKIGQKIK